MQLFKNKWYNLIIKAIGAGWVIGAGAAVKGSLGGQSGNIAFAAALLMIIAMDWNLYTGKVGGVIEGKITIPQLLVVLCGNWIGAILATSMIGNIGQGLPHFVGIGDLLMKAIGCGILMYIAVNCGKDKPWVTFACVYFFQQLGFIHSIVLQSLTLLDSGVWWMVLVAVIGNSIGAIVCAAVHNKVNSIL